MSNGVDPSYAPNLILGNVLRLESIAEDRFSFSVLLATTSLTSEYGQSTAWLQGRSEPLLPVLALTRDIGSRFGSLYRSLYGSLVGVAAATPTAAGSTDCLAGLADVMVADTAGRDCLADFTRGADVILADATGLAGVAEVTEVTGAADVADETVG